MNPECTDVLILGAGLAGSRTAETLRALGFEGRVLVCGDEPHLPYERPALSKSFLAGRATRGELALRDPCYWRDRGIEMRLSAPVESLDVRHRTAVVRGRIVTWQRLVMATGVRGRRLPALDRYDNAHQLRTLDDAARLAAKLQAGMRLAVIGAGFVGLEVASTARALGVDVSVIDVAAVPFATSLGREVGSWMAAIAAGRGVDLRLGRSVASVAGERRIDALVLDDGSAIECDVVLVGIGSVPNSELAAGQLALAEDGGVAVDARGRTTVDGVYACGDVVTSIDHGRIEHWSAASATARTVAHELAGVPPPEPAVSYFWTDQFAHRLQVVGHPRPGWEPSIDPSGGGFAARYHDEHGRVRAVALLDRPDLLAEARAQVTAGALDDEHRAVA